uniref:mitogen-activated protein kinase kinase n=1 Tax=Romanomermis culicivorax TaxID=13658 RepID=A0A915ILX8_ROMCU
MELMDISLERLYKSVFEKLKEKVPEEIIGKLAVSILKALSYLKELKVIHRDVKPSNILLNTQGNIKLCDFGIAGQLVDSIAKSRDVGCKPYMAPERIDPKRNSGYDVRSDVWSFGITLVEVATAQFPYPEWTSMFDQLQSVVKGDPPILTPTDHPYFTLDFIRFVNSCLTKDLEKRPKYPELMETPFFKKYEKSTVDVGGYVKEMLDRLSNNT